MLLYRRALSAKSPQPTEPGSPPRRTLAIAGYQEDAVTAAKQSVHILGLLATGKAITKNCWLVT